LLDNCLELTKDVDEIYNLAADMGRMGFIENNKAACMLSVLINTHLLMGAKLDGVSKFFFASSACVYNATKQSSVELSGLKEEDAYQAIPEDGYVSEKLFLGAMHENFCEDFVLKIRNARYYNIYGPKGNWDSGRQKALAVLCRKVTVEKYSGEKKIEIWGNSDRYRDSQNFRYQKIGERID
jgi:nucleoside-diphosphate-sugar epimerase